MPRVTFYPSAATRADVPNRIPCSVGSISPAGLQCGVTSSSTFNANFTVDANPIGAPWIRQNTGMKAMKTLGGRVMLTANTDNFDDGYAKLDPATWSNGANYQIDATIYKGGVPGADAAREIELLGRVNDSGTLVTAYECLLNIDAFNCSVVLWKTGASNPPVEWQIIGSNSSPSSVSDGDKIRATFIGNVISFYHQPGATGPYNLIAQATDSTWTSGQPGFAAFGPAGLTTIGTWGLSAWSVTPL